MLNTIVNREAWACGTHEFEIETTTLKGSSSLCSSSCEISSNSNSVFNHFWISLDYSLLDLDLHVEKKISIRERQ